MLKKIMTFFLVTSVTTLSACSSSNQHNNTQQNNAENITQIAQYSVDVYSVMIGIITAIDNVPEEKRICARTEDVTPLLTKLQDAYTKALTTQETNSIVAHLNDPDVKVADNYVLEFSKAKAKMRNDFPKKPEKLETGMQKKEMFKTTDAAKKMKNSNIDTIIKQTMDTTFTKCGLPTS